MKKLIPIILALFLAAALVAVPAHAVVIGGIDFGAAQDSVDRAVEQLMAEDAAQQPDEPDAPVEPPEEPPVEPDEPEAPVLPDKPNRPQRPLWPDWGLLWRWWGAFT